MLRKPARLYTIVENNMRQARAGGLRNLQGCAKGFQPHLHILSSGLLQRNYGNPLLMTLASVNYGYTNTAGADPRVASRYRALDGFSRIDMGRTNKGLGVGGVQTQGTLGPAVKAVSNP
jgi:hypothetical protein